MSRFSVAVRQQLAEAKMGRKIEVTRLELSAAKLRQLASRSSDGRVACRILAIANVLEGSSQAQAACASGMDRQTLRDWVHRYNHEGLGGLSDARRSGRPRSCPGAWSRRWCSARRQRRSFTIWRGPAMERRRRLSRRLQRAAQEERKLRDALLRRPRSQGSSAATDEEKSQQCARCDTPASH